MQTNEQIIRGYQGPPIRIMEVCGTHTHEIFRLGIRKLLPAHVQLISGPGCPVCVTPCGFIDEAVWLALERQALICTFGDLIKVPGTVDSLASARSKGAEIHPVYSPLDAVRIAEETPSREIVFLAVGFETTVPSACLAVKHAAAKRLENFSILGANKTMPNAYRALKGSADAFLYPGHVHAITGTSLCREMLSENVSGVIAGFTSEELLEAIAFILENAPSGKPFFKNCYTRVVREEGNPAACKIISEMMEPCDSEWRGLGVIPNSGLQLRQKYSQFDARKHFQMPLITGHPNPACRCGTVLQGRCLPTDCPLFGKLCTPQHPVGACMVSNEGACAAFYQYSEI